MESARTSLGPWTRSRPASPADRHGTRQQVHDALRFDSENNGCVGSQRRTGTVAHGGVARAKPVGKL